MLMSSRLGVCALVLAVFAPFGANNAAAITINGSQYDEVAAGNLGGAFGIWKEVSKGYTYKDFATRKNPDFVPISDLDLSNELTGAPIPAQLSVEFMLQSPGIFFGKLQASTLKLRDSSNKLLLELALSGSGATTGFAAFGDPGQANVVGLYNVVGGSWLTRGFLSGSIYAAVGYEFGTEVRKDFHLKNGSFSLYAPREGHTEVPEPASVALLLSGLVGVKGFKRRPR